MLVLARLRLTALPHTKPRTPIKNPSKPKLLVKRWKQMQSVPDPNRVPVPAIPRDKLQFSFTASSGPGGQNVNHVNTKVELRFKPAEAHWIPVEMRQRFIDMNKGRINKEGDMIITSQRERKQDANLEDCVAKLKQYLNEASWIPKERIATEVPEYENVKRIEMHFFTFSSWSASDAIDDVAISRTNANGLQSNSPALRVTTGNYQALTGFERSNQLSMALH